MGEQQGMLRVMVLALMLWSALSNAWAQSSPAVPIRIHVISNGWHAGLLLPAQALDARLPGLRERFPTAGHYEIGWGDLGFYQAREITLGLAFEALFASRGSLLHVVGWTGPVEPYLRQADTTSLCVSQAQYTRMVDLIAQAFVLDEAGQPARKGPGLYGDSEFYGAHGRYSLLNTCNRWTATVLEAGGLGIHPRISLTARSVLSAARAQGGACPP